MKSLGLAILIIVTLIGNIYASDKSHTPPPKDNKCIGAGPQSPRNINDIAGDNSVIFATAPAIEKMDLCNVHFHRNAEHKAAAYSTYVKDGSNSGWACQKPAVGRIGKEHVEYGGCEGIAEGDTIEIHWVHTSCDINSKGVTPMGSGLSACLTTLCPNPQLKVVAQVFVLQKNGKLKFSANTPIKNNGQAVVYTGSTTGTSYSNSHCSPFQVTWDVKTNCDTLDIDNFSKWCSHNKYNEHHAHGVRELVTSKTLLSKITK